jgi:hypothetical protein
LWELEVIWIGEKRKYYVSYITNEQTRMDIDCNWMHNSINNWSQRSDILHYSNEISDSK